MQEVKTPVSVSQRFFTKSEGATLQRPVGTGPQKPSAVAAIIAACVITSQQPLLTQCVHLDSSFVVQPEEHVDT